MSDEYKIIPDEKEKRAEEHKREMETFTKQIELEKSKRELKKQLQVGTHMLRATAEMLDALILDDFSNMCTDKEFMDKVMRLMDCAVSVQEALGND